MAAYGVGFFTQCTRPMTHHTLDTRWEGNDLLVLRNEQEFDRIRAGDIHRVILACRGGDTPSDLRFAVIETISEFIVLPPASGIAGRIHFERQNFWASRPCVYWVDERRVSLPRRLLPGVWLLRRPEPGYSRVPHEELAGVDDKWPLEGPQSWEQRKWAHIVRSRLLPPAVRNERPQTPR